MALAPHPALPFPYLLIPGQLKIDDAVSFVVSVLIAITVNAEAQGFAATFLGDARPGAKDRLHFNAFLHLDILGSLCFLLGGFGWARRIDVDRRNFRHPTVYSVLTRLAGPLGNFLMANIAASVAWIFTLMSMDSHVFVMVMGVNLTVATCNLIPVPPLAGGTILAALFLPSGSSLQQTVQKIGPFLVVALVAADRLCGWHLLEAAVSPMVLSLMEIIKL